MSVPLGTGGDYHLWIRTERNPDLLSPAVSGESFRARAHAGRAAYPVCVRRKRNCFRSRGRTVPSLPCRGSRRIPKRAKLPHSVQDRQTTAVLRKTAHIPARSDARGGRQARRKRCRRSKTVRKHRHIPGISSGKIIRRRGITLAPYGR